MYVGDIVFLPVEDGYVKYVIKKIVDDEILVLSYKSKQSNWLNKSDVLTSDEFENKYNCEKIYG